MKHVLCLVILATLFSACQKELRHPSIDATTLKEVSTSSSLLVTFEPYPDGDGTDNRSGSVNCLNRHFTVNSDDTIYQKQYIFSFRKSKAVVLFSAKLFIDGIRVKTVDTITANTIKFTMVTPKQVLASDMGAADYHFLTVQVRGDGPEGGWYQLTLERAVFYASPDQTTVIPTTGLPGLGFKMIYTQRL